MKNRLFRKEAIEAKQVKWVGDIILTRPISFTFLTIVGFGISICIIIFLILNFAKRLLGFYGFDTLVLTKHSKTMINNY